MIDRTTKLDALLATARERLDRTTPERAAVELREGAVMVDVRPVEQRERDGLVPGAIVIARNVLEWRCDPAGEARDPRLAEPGRRLIVMCDEGYQSSLAAATLQDIGLPRATDLVGGFQAWRAAGLPVEPA
jgi:rhodanese-related sulfurtransferase